MKYDVIEYRSTADTYQVEASSEEEAEHLVSEGKGELVRNWQEHDFYYIYPDVEETKQMKYEIQHSTFVDGWVNTSTTEDADGNEIPLVFDSRAEAQEEIDSDLAYIADQIASGEREADYGYDPEEFRVREVARVSDLDKATSK
jgi:hypothetical protein